MGKAWEPMGPAGGEDAAGGPYRNSASGGSAGLVAAAAAGPASSSGGERVRARGRAGLMRKAQGQVAGHPAL